MRYGDMNNTPRVLIADDDPLSLRKLEFLLVNEGFMVSTATDGEQALRQLEADNPPSLAVLDVLMPKVDGVEVCRRVRTQPRAIPSYLILLTVKSSKEDIVKGLEAGANDYVAKPFDQAELLARLRVGLHVLTLQRRLAARVEDLENALTRMRHLQVLLRKDTHIYEFGDFRLEAAEQRLSRSGFHLTPTARVFDLLLLLVQNAGHLLEKEEIMREVWHDAEIEENNLTVSMSVLRKLLGDSAEREYIETVPKRGYRFTAEVRRFA
jgi:DNA-binding response OmpR family regulator